MALSVSNRIGLGVLVAGFVSIGALFGGIAYMAAGQDRQAAASETKMIEGGLESMVGSLRTFTQDYAWWPDFYAAARRRDAAWMDPNFGMGVYNNRTFDIGIVLDDTGQPIAAWEIGTGATPDIAIADESLRSAVTSRLAKEPAGKIPAQSIFMTMRGKPAVLAFTRLYPVDNEDQAADGKLPILIMGNYLSEERVSGLGNNFLIGDLKLQDESVNPSIVTESTEGSTLGYLAWTPSTPGTATLKQSILPVAALSLIAVLAAFFFGNVARRNALRLVEAESKAKAEAALAQDLALRNAKLAQLGQLTATVAHEIRNPLGAVRTSAFLLSRKLINRGLGVEAQVERIEHSIARCDNIITQLLDFTRSQDLDCAKAPIDDWLAKVVEEHASQIPENVQVRCELAIGAVEVPFDPGRMQRVIINLLSNAAEALTGKEGGQAASENRELLISVESRLTERGAEITVRDNGPGIPPELKERILDPLFTTKSFGTGLGLPASANVMARHGGGLECQSEPGAGASFTVWLPLDGASRANEQQKAAA